MLTSQYGRLISISVLKVAETYHLFLLPYLYVEDYENFGGDYEYNIANILDYIDYLNLLKTVEHKLKTELQETSKNPAQGVAEKEEKDAGVKSRKKRSLESSMSY